MVGFFDSVDGLRNRFNDCFGINQHGDAFDGTIRICLGIIEFGRIFIVGIVSDV